MALCELVKIRTEKGIKLTGAFYSVGSPRAAIVHVHGSCGNFYEAGFLGNIAQLAVDSNVCFLTFNLRSHDCIAEGYGDDGYFEYVGGSIQSFETCLQDINNAISFVSRCVDKIFLNGHSLGCDRVVHYLLSDHQPAGDIYGCSLLSPCDSYALHQAFICPESVEEQITRLKNTDNQNPMLFLEEKEYGIKYDNENYYIPVSKNTLLSIAEGPPFQVFNINKPSNYHIALPCLAVIGGDDSLQVHKESLMFSYLKERTPKTVEFFLPHAEHDFEGYEQDVAEALMNFVVRVLEKRDI